MIDESKKADSPQTRRKKLAAAIVIALVIAVTLFFVNHARNFLQGFLISYLIWLIIDWYDCFVIDWIWVCHSKKLIIPGTEDLVDSYKDYRFHFIGSQSARSFSSIGDRVADWQGHLPSDNPRI